MSSIQGTISNANIVTLDDTQTLTNKTIELDTTDLFNTIPLLGSDRCVTSNGIKFALNLKQDNLTFNAPSSNNANPSTSAQIKTALDLKQDNLTFNAPSSNNGNPSTSAQIKTALDLKQDTLTFSNVGDANGNPSTSAQINNYLAVNYQPVLTFNGPPSNNNNPSTSAQIKAYTETNFQPTLTFNGPPSNNNNPSTSAQIKAYTENNFQPTLTFQDPSARTGNPSTSLQIDNYLINNYQPKNNLIYDATNDFLGVDVQPYRKFDMGPNRVALGDNVTLNNNQGIYWHTSQFDYSIARENGGWGSTRELAIRWSTGIRFQVDPTRTITGNVAYTNSSDTRLKHNEVDISNALTTINKLHVKKYYKTGTIYDPSGNVYPPDYNLTEQELETTPHTEEIGIIAQEIQQIPELEFVVKDNGLDASGNQKPYSVNYESIHNLLIQSVQELSKQVNELKQEVHELKQK